MMERKINCTLLLVIISFIGHSLAAVSFPFGLVKPEKAYTESKSASVHRGLFLSYSSTKKTGICRDLFSEYYVDETVISDGLENDDQPQHALIVGKISQFVEGYWLEGKVVNLFFKCSGKNLKPQSSVDIEYFVSSTFRHGFMYNGAEEYKSDGMIGVMLNEYIGMSPEYVSLKQTELEIQYITSRRIIKALGKESPTYVEMIEGRDNISALSKWQKFLLCSSIILSPTHESDRHRFSLNWVNYAKNVEKGIHQYTTKRLTFEHDNYYEEEKWSADCLYCTPPAEAADGPKTIKGNLLLTRAYTDKHSLYVLIEEEGIIRFKDYVENVPILMNTRVPFTDDPEYIHPLYKTGVSETKFLVT